MKRAITRGETKKLPSYKAVRHHLLKRIREARFPKDESKFTIEELKASNLWLQYKQPSDLSDTHFKVLVLLAAQAAELREKCDELTEEINELKPYVSPLWAQVGKHPDPIKDQELMALIRADEERDAQARLVKKEKFHKMLTRMMAHFGRRTWENRDKKKEPSNPVLWHRNMSVSDYHEATGMSVRHIRNILTRLKAKPLKPIKSRLRKNEPSLYPPVTNLKILREWLVVYEKDPDRRRAWLAKTLLKYKNEAPDNFDDFITAISPLFLKLGMNTEDKIKGFTDYCRQIEPLLHSPPSYPNLKALASLNSAP